MFEQNQLNPNVILDSVDIGLLVKAKRKQNKLTQAQTSALCNVGTRFLSELENGKKTLEVGKVLQVLTCLGLKISITSREWQE